MKQTLCPSTARRAPLLRWITLLGIVIFASAASAQTNWTGAVNADWSNSQNWTAGVPDANDHVIVAPSSNNPVISGTTQALANSILIRANSKLTINTSGSLTINGSAAYTAPFNFTAGINNLGTIANQGSIVLGSVSEVGSHGMVNQGSVTNNGAGLVQIQRMTETGLLNLSGIFRNDAKVTIGSAIVSGANGIWSDYVFQNFANGEITVNGVSDKGIVNSVSGAGGANATFSNEGKIVVGAEQTVGSIGIDNAATFNSSGGSISLDKTTTSALYNAGTFTLGGAMVIGNSGTAGTSAVNNVSQMSISTCGSLVLNSGGFVSSSEYGVWNSGYVRVAGSLSISNADFINDGLLKYGNASGSISNNSLTVMDDPGPIFAYGNSFTGTITGIYIDPAGTQSAGTFVAPNLFITTLAPGPYTLYASVALQGGACSYLVPFSYVALVVVPDIVVSGNGVDIVNGDKTPSSEDHTDFGTQHQYTWHPVVRKFTIKNPGTAPLILENTIVGSMNFTHFVLSKQPDKTIAPSGETSFEITFKPVMNGPINGEVQIETNVPGKSKYTFEIKGNRVPGCEVVTSTNEPISWTAMVNNDWKNPCNWYPNKVPTKDDHMILPKNRYLHLTQYANMVVKSFEVQEGASFTLYDVASLTVVGTRNIEGVETSVYNAGSIHNVGLFTIESTSTGPVHALKNVGRVYNSPCSTLRLLRGDLVNEVGKSFVNAGYMFVKETISIAPNASGGTYFVSSGVLKYGRYDNVLPNADLVVYDAPTPIFKYSSNFRGRIDGIFLNEQATDSAGVFTKPNIFRPLPSLGVGRYTLYAKITLQDRPCSYVVPFIYEISGKQTTWTGSESSVWSNPANWTAGVPGQYSHVIIPDVARDPAVGQNSVAYSVLIESAASLLVKSGITLTINGYSTYTEPSNFTSSLNNKGTLNIAGLLVLGSTRSLGDYGLMNQGTVSNLAGGEIRIDRATNAGIFNGSGTWTNHGNITIGADVTTGLHGIWNHATFHHNGGEIRIDRSSASALKNNTVGSVQAVFSNAAKLTIGSNEEVGTNGIENLATLSNLAAGNIVINRSSENGLLNSAGTLMNEGTIAVGGAVGVGVYGITNRAILDNRAGGKIRIDRSDEAGLFNATNAVLHNEGEIVVGADAAVGLHGVFNEAGFDNKAGGDIHIDRTMLSALWNLGGAFTNAGNLTIGAVASAGTNGIRNQAPFANLAGGNITIDNVSRGIYTESNTFTNAGNITIGSLTAVGTLLASQGSGRLSNDNNGVFRGTGQIASTAFLSEGGVIAPGYSPGKLTYDNHADFTKSTIEIEVDGISAAGSDYDQIVVNGTATLGGVLKVTSAYTPAPGQEITILSASAITGTFTAFAGSASNWKVAYTPTEVKLQYLDPMPVRLIDFSAKVAETAVQLNWKTATETDNEGFHIERSTNARQWETIGFVKGNATATVEHMYAFLDGNPRSGLNYYRLRQVDFDGTTDYSVIRAVQFGTQSTEVTVWADAARVAHVRSEEPIEQVTVFSLSGRVLAKGKFSSVNLASVPAGIVLVQVQTKDGVVTRKLLLP